MVRGCAVFEVRGWCALIVGLLVARQLDRLARRCRLEWLARCGWSGLLVAVGVACSSLAVGLACPLLTLTGLLVMGADAGFQRMVLAFSWIPSEVCVWPSIGFLRNG